MSKIRFIGADIHPTVRMDEATNLLMVDEGKDTQEKVNPRTLRLQCRYTHMKKMNV